MQGRSSSQVQVGDDEQVLLPHIRAYIEWMYSHSWTEDPKSKPPYPQSQTDHHVHSVAQVHQSNLMVPHHFFRAQREIREREVRRSFLTGHLYIYKLASTHPCKEILHPERGNSTKMIQSLLVFVLSLHIVTALIYGSDAPERKVRTYVHGTCIFSVWVLMACIRAWSLIAWHTGQ